ncbi:hypothetical protein C8R43DRAFT_1067569 [Mycena crocata]|nr:hypothetical protein C8R43DRAFT_1067569 [Mycena crocata]
MASTTSTPPQSVISSTIGPMVIGILVQSLLFGIILHQGARYFEEFNTRDSPGYRYFVWLLLFLNTFEFVLDCHVIYRTLSTHFGQYEFFDHQTWTMWSEPGVTALIGCLSQAFFIDRCWHVTHKSRPVLVFLAFLLCLSFGSGLAVSVSFFKVKLFSKLALIPIPISFWLIATAVTDAAIAAILSVELLRNSSSFNRTRAVVTKIIRLSIETSAITAFTAIVNLILYFALPMTAFHLIPQFSICRVYTITVLVTLLGRDDLRKALTETSAAFSSFALTRPVHDSRAVNAVEVNVKTVVERDIREQSLTEPEPRSHSSDTKSNWTGSAV